MCKYLGIEESHDIQHKKEKEKLKKEYLRRLRLVLGTELSAKNKIQETGTLAVPVLRYSFEIINWCQELQKLGRKMMKLLTIHGQHQLKIDIDHIYVPRKQGGRDLMQLEAYVVEITKLVECVNSKEDLLTQTVRMHQHNINSIMLQTARHLKTELQTGARQRKTPM